MKKIAIQAGHNNIQYNSIVSLRRSTGSPNEAEFNRDIRDRVSDELRKRGFEVQGTDANANDNKNITGKDWDLFLTIHYDADIYGTGGGFVDFPEPKTDHATVESQRIAREIESVYFQATGIANKPNRRNANTKYYYMWKYLSAKTPCVIIECGVGMHVPDDWEKLHFNRPLIVEGIVRGVCKAFNVPYETEKPKTEVEKLEEEIKKLKQELEQARKDLEGQKRSSEIFLQQRIKLEERILKVIEILDKPL